MQRHVDRQAQSRRSGRPPAFLLILYSTFLATWLVPSPAARAADLDDAQKLYRSGKYEECIEACAKGVEGISRDENWWILKARAELATGKYPQALETFEAAQSRYERSIPVLLAGYDVFRANNKPEEADGLLIAIRTLAVRTPWRYSDSGSKVALGRALLKGGADARQVLELFFDQAK